MKSRDWNAYFKKAMGGNVEQGKGSTHHICYLHEEFCERPDGGACTCNPTVEMGEPHSWRRDG